MARIREFHEVAIDRMTLHDAIDANYWVEERDGRVLLQINTMGRENRQMPGKISQAIQLDEQAARQLHEIIGQAFKLK